MCFGLPLASLPSWAKVLVVLCTALMLSFPSHAQQLRRAMPPQTEQQQAQAAELSMRQAQHRNALLKGIAYLESGMAALPPGEARERARQELETARAAIQMDRLDEASARLGAVQRIVEAAAAQQAEAQRRAQPQVQPQGQQQPQVRPQTTQPGQADFERRQQAAFEQERQKWLQNLAQMEQGLSALPAGEHRDRAYREVSAARNAVQVGQLTEAMNRLSDARQAMLAATTQAGGLATQSSPNRMSPIPDTLHPAASPPRIEAPIILRVAPYCDQRPPVGPAVRVEWKSVQGADGYRVFRNGSLIGGPVPANETVFSNNKDVNQEHTYRYEVQAIKRQGQSMSQPVTAFVPGGTCGLQAQSASNAGNSGGIPLAVGGPSGTLSTSPEGRQQDLLGRVGNAEKRFAQLPASAVRDRAFRELSLARQVLATGNVSEGKRHYDTATEFERLALIIGVPSMGTILRV